MGEVAEVVLKCRKSGHNFAFQPEGGMSIPNPLFGFRNHFKDRLAQVLESSPFRFVNSRQVTVNFGTSHDPKLLAKRVS